MNVQHKAVILIGCALLSVNYHYPHLCLIMHAIIVKFIIDEQ